MRLTRIHAGNYEYSQGHRTWYVTHEAYNENTGEADVWTVIFPDGEEATYLTLRDARHAIAEEGTTT